MATLKITRRGKRIVQVTMARPEVLNALDEAMMTELDAAFLTERPAPRSPQ